jgi:triacylglycerol lipase
MMKAASGALTDLTPEHMASFNRKYKDVPTVKYYSVTSTFTPTMFYLLF